MSRRRDPWTHRQCRVCGQVKARADFPRKGRKCRACKAVADRAWARANRDRRRAYCAAYRARVAADPTRRKRQRLADRIYYARTRQRRLAWAKAYRAAHPGWNAAHCRQYYAAHRDEINARRRAQKATPMTVERKTR